MHFIGKGYKCAIARSGTEFDGITPTGRYGVDAAVHSRRSAGRAAACACRGSGTVPLGSGLRGWLWRI